MAQANAKPSPLSKVWIQQANRTIPVLANQTVIEAALEQGVDYPHGCRSGRCGTCKSRLIDGKVDLLEHSRFALTDEEKAQGLILACCAIPTTDVIVAWLGGGSGLAPFKGIVEAAIARGMKQPIHVYFGARSGRDLYLVNYFERLAERHPNLAFTPEETSARRYVPGSSCGS